MNRKGKREALSNIGVRAGAVGRRGRVGVMVLAHLRDIDWPVGRGDANTV